MRDFPKWLNTKQDYINCLNLYPDETKKSLQVLIDSRFTWFQTAILADNEQGITDETHKIVESENERSQYELQEDSNARIFQLGFTVPEVQALIGGGNND